MTLLPEGASVTPFEKKIDAMNANAPSKSWYDRAVSVLRGGDGGEHGVILYGLVLQLSASGHPLVVLDVGTARGFSAMAAARAMLDANREGRVYSVDIIDHHESRSWHVDKQEADEPLSGIEMSRSEIWERWFPDESDRVVPINDRSSEVLRDWQHGPIDLAFLDGSHTYDSVKRELSSLDSTMRLGGAIVLDDYHSGMSAARIRSRPINLMAWALGKILPPMRRLSPSLGESNEYVVVRRRFSGIWQAVSEFLEERRGRWDVEIVSMPSRGDYQGGDYSLAVLTMRGSESPSDRQAHPMAG